MRGEKCWEDTCAAAVWGHRVGEDECREKNEGRRKYKKNEKKTKRNKKEMGIEVDTVREETSVEKKMENEVNTRKMEIKLKEIKINGHRSRHSAGGEGDGCRRRKNVRRKCKENGNTTKRNKKKWA